MADNVPVTPGAGASIATDDVGGVQYQRVKVTFGVDGSAADVSAASPLPITVPGTVAVTGTFYPATQPVSGTVAISGTVPVSGTFYQATQPVSIASMPSTPVTGTFWQATQPVSLATNTPTIAAGSAIIGKVGIDQTTPGTTNLVNIGTNGTVAINAAIPTGSNVIGALTANQSVNVAQMNGVAVTMGSGVTGTGVQRVVLATDIALPTGANVIGALSANQSVNNAQFNGVTPLMGNGVTGTGSLRVTIASDNTAFAVNATGPTLTKGTQAATGYSVQELKDAGRSCLAMTATFAFAQTAETLLTMTVSVDGAATTTFSSRVITNGKRFRIQSIQIGVESLGSGTAPQRAYLRLRRNTAGATTASSSLQSVWLCANNTAIVKSSAFMDYEVPDGLEMTGDGTGTFGFTLETPDWVTSTATGQAKITVIGFEY